MDFSNIDTKEQLARYGYLIVIIALYAIAVNYSPKTMKLFLNRKGRMQFGGDSRKHQIGVSLLLILSLIALGLSFNSLNFMSILFILGVIVIGHAVTGELLLSVAIGIILGSVVVSYSTTSDQLYSNGTTEFFEEKEAKEGDDATGNAKGNAKDNAKGNAKDNAKVKTNGTEVAKEGAKAKKEKDDSEVDVELDTEETFQFDQKSTVLDLYNSLSEEQVKGMKKDTRELMETQQQLIKTLNEMGPTLKQSKEVLASFQNYFGDDKEMDKKLTELKSLKL
jgi:hypothetical protein